MSYLKKIFLAFGIIVLIVIVLAVGAVFILPESDLMRENIQEQLRASTGKEITIGAIQVSPTFPNLVSLSVRDVSALSAAGTPVLHIARLDCLPSWGPLLSGELAIQSLKIHGLKVVATRKEDGSITGVFVPVPASGAAPIAPVNDEAAQDANNAPAPQPATAQKRKLRWSIDSVELTNAHFIFHDKAIKPGQDVVTSCSLDGKMLRTPGENGFLAELSGKIEGAENTSAPLRLKGVFGLNDPSTQVVRGDANLSLEAAPPKLFTAYIPQNLKVVEGFTAADLNAHAVFKKDAPALVNAKALLRAGQEPTAAITIDSELRLNERFSAVEEAKAVVTTEGLPTAPFASALPVGAGVDLTQGLLKGKAEGVWKGPESWKTTGEFELNGIGLKKLFKISGPNLRLAANLALDPTELVIHKLDLGAKGKELTVTGKILTPFQPDRVFDLHFGTDIGRQLLQEFGADIPRELHFKGKLPTKGRLKGKEQSMSVDVQGSLAGAEIGWADVIQKPATAGGTVSAQTRLSGFSYHNQPLHVAFEIPNARLKAGGGSQRVALAGSAQVTPKQHGADVRDASVRLRRGTAVLASVKGDVNGAGAKNMVLDLAGSVLVDKGALALVGGTPDDIKLNGATQARFKVSGTPERLSWAVDAPLQGLDLAIGNDFRKAAGVGGALKASGKLLDEEIHISAGNLTLPGVNIAFSGIPKDAKGKFKRLNLDVKKTDLKNAAEFFPALAAARLSGPVVGTVQLTGSGDRIVPSGVVQALGINYRPENAGLAVEKIRGTISAAGRKLTLKNIQGHVSGALDGPVKVNGDLENYDDPKQMTGAFVLRGGPGHLRSARLKSVLQQTEAISRIFNVSRNDPKADPMAFQELAGDLLVRQGIVSTDNLKFHGTIMNAGVVGAFNTHTGMVDMEMGVRTSTVLGAALGKIPAVQQVLKQNSGWIKAMGLDKELKRLGVDTNAAGAPQEGAAEPPKATPLTLFFKIKGRGSSPEVAPMLEAAISRPNLAKLKTLID